MIVRHTEGRMTAGKTTRLLSRPSLQIPSTYVAAIALCLLLLAWVLHLDHAELNIPFADEGDALLHSMLVKSIIDNGWVWHNPYLGAPYRTQLLDFPFYDNLDLALMRLLALFTSNYAVVLNLFFLLTFPLTVLCSMLALRSFKVSYMSAIVVSLLYAFIPFHFYRGEGHLLVGVYFLLPLMTMVILWMWTGQLNRRRMGLALLICVLVGCAYPYYAFFGCYFLAVVAIASAIRFSRPQNLAWGTALIAVVFGTLIFNTSPTWLYAMRHGRNHEVAERPPFDSEVYALKLTNLLLPMTDHRVKVLRDIKQTYDRDVQHNERDAATLGTVASLGVLFLLGWLFSARREDAQGDIITALAVLTVAAVLLGTLGGFGSIFNYLVASEIRCYNRVSIYIAFFSLFAVALLLDALRRWMRDGPFATWLWRGLLVVVLGLGILDQTNPSFAPNYARTKRRYQSEGAFIAQIEASVPSGAMIFQLPNVHFPEVPSVAAMNAYDELRGYLHSRSLRWSSGAMKGRPEALWEQRNGLDIGNEPAVVGPEGVRTIHEQFPAEALNTLVFAGFNGIYVDRYGFADRGSMITSQLQALLREPPLLSKDHRLEFFDLTPFATALRAKYTSEQWETETRKALALPSP